MKKRQLKEFERLLDNCDFYFKKHDAVRYTNEVGALRGFSYALKEDWSLDLSCDLLNRYTHHISKNANYMNKNEEYVKFVFDFYSDDDK